MKKNVLAYTLIFVGMIYASVLGIVYYQGRQNSIVTPPQDFFVLRGKTEAEIESLYGVPTASELWFDGESHVKKYRITETARLEVRYTNGVARGFVFDIPLEWQSSDAEKSLRTCGLNMNVHRAEETGSGLRWWVELPDHSKGLVRLDRLEGSYFICEADL
jgi:hypothetical protein